ncbi:MAG TPA: SIS domain-containing protein [Terriglobales bacterium]|nr:SIS domain-containing protein [Terriglobales bacterium]
MKFAADYLEDLKKTLARLDAAEIGKAAALLGEARDNHRSVFVLGNGGSAAIASHLVVDLLKGASFGRRERFRIMSLSDNIPTVTAYLNDVGPDAVFVEQLKNFARTDDVVIAISGSGDSPNVLAAVEYANGIGCRTIGMTRADGGALRGLVGLRLAVPSGHLGRLEDSFTVMAHILAYAFMERAVD